MHYLRVYLSLSKPGILFGNAVTAIGGFALGLSQGFDSYRCVAMLLGLSQVMASACSVNNYIDRFFDAKMLRTERRVLVTGAVTPKKALIFACSTLLAGMTILGIYVNGLALSLSLCGFVIYIFAYSLLKYKTYHATLIGSIAGAVPPVVGYVAASNQLDGTALFLFLLVALWQMPHFYAIALYRKADYAAAGIPVLPLVKGERTTKVHMLLYTLAFGCVGSFFKVTTPLFSFIAASLTLMWALLAIYGFVAKETKRWARSMFLASLLIIFILSATMWF